MVSKETDDWANPKLQATENGNDYLDRFRSTLFESKLDFH